MNPHFFEPPNNLNLLNYSIFRTNFRFPWRFEKSGFHCIVKIITLSAVTCAKNAFTYDSVTPNFSELVLLRFSFFLQLLWKISIRKPSKRTIIATLDYSNFEEFLSKFSLLVHPLTLKTISMNLKLCSAETKN